MPHPEPESKEIKKELGKFYEVPIENIKLLKRWKIYGHRLTTVCSFGRIGDHHHYDFMVKLAKPIIVEYCNASNRWREDWLQTLKIRER